MYAGNERQARLRGGVEEGCLPFGGVLLHEDGPQVHLHRRLGQGQREPRQAPHQQGGPDEGVPPRSRRGAQRPALGHQGTKLRVGDTPRRQGLPEAVVTHRNTIISLATQTPQWWTAEDAGTNWPGTPTSAPGAASGPRRANA